MEYIYNLYELKLIEFYTKLYTVLNKCKYVLLVLLFVNNILPLLFIIISEILIILFIIFSRYKKNTIVIKINNKIIGFINGDKNHIYKLMILPLHQLKGYGTMLLNKYIRKYCKLYTNYYFYTNILLNSLIIFKNKDVNDTEFETNNYLRYKIIKTINWDNIK